MSETLQQEGSLLQTLPESIQLELRGKAYTQRYQKNEQITRQNEPSSDLFIVHYGTARVTIYSPSGIKLTFTDIKASEYFGELAAIDGKPRTATVIAVEETLVTRIPEERFNEYVANHPEFTKLVMRNLCSIIRRLNERIYEFTTLDVRQRIHSELLRIVERLEVIDNTAVQDLPPTHAEIAARISSHREAVSREYNKLQNAGILEKRSKQLVFKDVAALRDLVHQEATKQ
ncbi:MAG: CRP/FNR family cyclic AMP-dependent transcriptional regulator [Saprospiraceae bacterium]|jgi:CRP/FNR family cyclic AMP-dependent transcriptional regulator